MADYRGYGDSDGKPTIANMIGDAHTIFQGFKEIIEQEGFNGGRPLSFTASTMR
ncbi:MAG: hypothetical protein HYY80_02400 [Chloroflexi bacterium]|nr:hypothetical protein [Chloroflexota bacterium]